jgi:hypothetical protein
MRLFHFSVRSGLPLFHVFKVTRRDFSQVFHALSAVT